MESLGFTVGLKKAGVAQLRLKTIGEFSFVIYMTLLLLGTPLRGPDNAHLTSHTHSLRTQGTNR